LLLACDVTRSYLQPFPCRRHVSLAVKGIVEFKKDLFSSLTGLGSLFSLRIIRS
jgi:hypothetical protein